jgi:RND family efflux transporter MFP subunit
MDAARAARSVVVSVGSGTQRLYFVVIVWLIAGVGGVGLISSRRSAASRADVAARTDAHRAGPRVLVTTATTSAPVRTLRLQGEVRPYASVTLYGKIAGYLRDVRVDKGDQVRAGQVLATIISPELDQQVLAARADAQNKRRQAKRMLALAGPGVVATQDVEAATSGADVAEAQAESVRTQDAYRTLRAPFAGTVTARFADPGALIQSAAGAQSGALPVVTVADVKRLRIYVYLDQASASFVKVGDGVVIRVAERPGWSRPAKVARLSGELAPRTRTMLTEIDVDNNDGAILPGSFVEAEIQIRVPSLVEMPAEAVVTRGARTFASVVDGESHLHFRPVRLASDDGETARVLEGVHAGETVALNIGETLDDGVLVQSVRRQGPPSPGTGPKK